MTIGLNVVFKRTVKVSLPTEAGIIKFNVPKGRTGQVMPDHDDLVVRLDEPLQTGHDFPIYNVRWRDWDDALHDINITGKGHLRLVSVNGELIDES